MKVLIIGIAGFAGSHLAELLLHEKSLGVYGLVRKGTPPHNLKAFKSKLRLSSGDMLDAKEMRKLLQKIKPDIIYHLAAQSASKKAWEHPAQTLETNILGTLNILEAMRSLKTSPVIQVVGSSEEYGLIQKSQIPIKETTALNPITPYGVSKVAQDLLARQYHHSFGLKIVRTRAFSHFGPRQSCDFAASNFAKQVAMIETGKTKPVIYTGNLDTVKDFTDVRDVVKAYVLAAHKGTPGEVYNICRGQGHAIHEIVDFYLEEAHCRIKIKKDLKRLRPDENPPIVGDPRKFFLKTGWKPKIAFKESLLDILNYWRAQVAA